MTGSSSSADSSRERLASVRLIAVLLAASMSLVSACSIGQTATISATRTVGTGKAACYAKVPGVRMWMRDTLAVTLRLPPNVTVSDDAVNGAVLGELASIVKDKNLGTLSASASTDQRTDALVRGGSDATAFYSLMPVGDTGASSLSAVCDQRVIEAVDAVNQMLRAKTSQDNTVLTPIVVHATGTNATGAPTDVPISILGASPDWIFTGRPTGSGFGHPSGPPRLPSGFSLDQASDLAPVSADSGAGTTVVVLDTGYKLDQVSGVPSPPVSCGADTCVPVPKPLYTSSKVSAALSSTPNSLLIQLSRYVQESDMQVATDTPEAGSSDSGPLAEFSDTSGNPVNIIDHGLFISGVIHQAAPAAKIVLIRVLNDYGVGDLRSILTAVDTVANHPDQLGIPAGQRVVVNMSLGFGPSASCLVGTYRSWLAIQQSDAAKQQPYGYDCIANKTNEGSSSLSSSGPVGFPGADAALTLGLSVAVSDLANGPSKSQLSSVAVVAAAGNESTGVKPALDADLPAGICGVVPVAALTYAGGASSPTQADFSNNASLSGNQCLNVAVSSNSVTVSLQGETRPSVGAAGVNDCGVFLQPVPSATLDGVTTTGGSTAPNDEVLWNGTSFAAGWASGYIARAGMPAGSSFTVPDMQKCNSL